MAAMLPRRLSASGAPVPPADVRRSLWPKAPRVTSASLFAHGMCLTCLFLQRFGYAFESGQQLFISLVICPLLIIAMLVAGKARIRASTALLFMLMLCGFLASTVCAILAPAPDMRFSTLSVSEVAVLYAMLMIEPADGFDSRVVLRVFAFYARIIAAFAIIQYALQFVGLKLFSFTDIAPALKPILAERGYHVVAPLKYGSSIFRSNGLLLLEPSILSQVLALGIIVDFFVLSRVIYLPLFAVALLTSYSGTGILALAGTLAIIGVLSPRQLLRASLFLVLAAFVTALYATAFPDAFASLASRATGADPSARLRYTAELEVLKTILSDARVVVGFGPGAADGYIFSGTMSAALKLFFDYGLLGLTTFILFLVRVLWRTDKPILSIVSLIIFQTGGGYLVFSPMVFLLVLVCVWSKPVRPVVVRRAPALRRQAVAAPA